MSKDKGPKAGLLDAPPFSVDFWRNAVFETASDAKILLDGGGKIVDWNRHAEKVLGWARAEILGSVFAETILAPDAEQDVDFARALEQTPPDSDSGEFRKISFRHRQGHSLRLYLHLRTLPAEGRFIMASIRERHADKATEAARLEAQKLESIGQLAGGIAHDFNNSLAAIIGYSSLLTRDLKENPKALEKVKFIREAADRGAALTKQLLGFARKGQYQKKVIPLAGVVEEAKQVLSRSLDKSIQVHGTPLDSAWLIEGDATQILQVLMNLGVNSRDAMPDGGELVIEATEVIVDTDHALKLLVKPGRYLRVAIRDTGTGIPREIQEKVFDPFFTTKELGKGTGMGLAMVYGIMKNHEGAVLVESEPGKGTEFSLYFPSVGRATLKAGGAVEETGEGAELSLSGKTILVVDDEPLLRSLAREILEPLGAQILVANDGLEGLETFARNRDRIFAVILDVGMPRLNGIETYRRLKQTDSGVPILFATGYADNKQIRTLIQEEGARFVEKPFSPSTLLKELARIVASGAELQPRTR